MDSSTAVIQPPITRDESGTLLGQTMGLVAVTTGFFAVGAYLGRDLAYGWGWALFIAAIQDDLLFLECAVGMEPFMVPSGHRRASLDRVRIRCSGEMRL